MATDVLWVGMWGLLVAIVAAIWAVRGVLDVETRFGLHDERRVPLHSRIPACGVVCSEKLAWAWILMLALLSVPTFDALGWPLPAGSLVALSGGVGVIAQFAGSAVAYLLLPSKVRHGEGGRWAVGRWFGGLLGAGALLGIVGLVLNWWVALGS